MRIFTKKLFGHSRCVSGFDFSCLAHDSERYSINEVRIWQRQDSYDGNSAITPTLAELIETILVREGDGAEKGQLPAVQTDLVQSRLTPGAQVRLFLDAAPACATPAIASYVSDTVLQNSGGVQAHGDQRPLMLRARANIDQHLLQHYLHQGKPGLTGIVWVKLDPQPHGPQPWRWRSGRL